MLSRKLLWEHIRFTCVVIGILAGTLRQNLTWMGMCQLTLTFGLMGVEMGTLMPW